MRMFDCTLWTETKSSQHRQAAAELLDILKAFINLPDTSHSVPCGNDSPEIVNTSGWSTRAMVLQSYLETAGRYLQIHEKLNLVEKIMAERKVLSNEDTETLKDHAQLLAACAFVPH